MKHIQSYEEFISQLERVTHSYRSFQRNLDKMLEDAICVEDLHLQEGKTYTGAELATLITEASKRKKEEQNTIPEGHIQHFLEAFIQL